MNHGIGEYRLLLAGRLITADTWKYFYNEVKKNYAKKTLFSTKPSQF